MKKLCLLVIGCSIFISSLALAAEYGSNDCLAIENGEKKQTTVKLFLPSSEGVLIQVADFDDFSQKIFGNIQGWSLKKVAFKLFHWFRIFSNKKGKLLKPTSLLKCCAPFIKVASIPSFSAISWAFSGFT